jgi:hypothetical protein
MPRTGSLFVGWAQPILASPRRCALYISIPAP